jgi:hypothetical protein
MQPHEGSAGGARSSGVRAAPAMVRLLLLLVLAGATAGCLSNECDPQDYPRCHGTELRTCEHGDLTYSRFDYDCARDGQVCVEANDTAACVAPALTTCSRQGPQCSPDGQRSFYCNAGVGYVTSELDCSAEGAECREVETVAPCVIGSMPCTGYVSRCAAGGARVLGCNPTLGFYALGERCAANEVCVESDYDAGCVDASLTPCGAGEETACSADGALIYSLCDHRFGYYRSVGPCWDNGHCVDAEGWVSCED